MAEGKRLLFHHPDLDDKGPAGDSDERVTVVPPDQCGKANPVSSLCDDGMHRPVIDIDLGCALIESTTPGHHHLYIDKAMTWPQLLAILEALAAAGVVGPNYLAHAKRRGMTRVRPSWCKKASASPPSDGRTVCSGRGEFCPNYSDGDDGFCADHRTQ